MLFFLWLYFIFSCLHKNNIFYFSAKSIATADDKDISKKKMKQVQKRLRCGTRRQIWREEETKVMSVWGKRSVIVMRTPNLKDWKKTEIDSNENKSSVR